MKKKFLLLMILLLMPIISFALVSPNPLLGGKLDRGVGRVSYYIDYPSGAGFYEYQIIAAHNGWEYTGWNNPIYMVAASSNWGTMVDFYAKTNEQVIYETGLYGVLAYTGFYNINGVQQNPYSDYRYTEIVINDGLNHDREETLIKATLLHELGHAFGMDENNGNAYSIMAQTWARNVQTVQKCDNDAIITIYGW